MQYVVQTDNYLITTVMQFPGIREEDLVENQYIVETDLTHEQLLCSVIKDGVLTYIGDRPPNSKLDLKTLKWTYDLDLAKRLKWDDVKAARDKLEFESFLFLEKKCKCDKETQTKINSFAQQAIIDPNFSIDWIFEDNSVTKLSSLDIINLSKTLALHIKYLYTKSLELREKIDNCSSKAELESISIYM